MAEQLTVSIIGCGVKGAFGPVSHAEAFQKAGFKIAGFWDVNPEKSEQAAVKWGGVAYNNKAHAFRERVDVVVIAAPDEYHTSLIAEFIATARLVFCEKPFGRSYEMAEDLVDLYRASGQSLAVNYTRRFSPAFQQVRGMVQRGELGDFLGGSGFYGNGLYHNGSHMIDMLRMLVGEVTVPFSGIRIADTKLEDPSVYGFIVVASSPFYLGVVPRAAVNAFEATLYFSAGVVRITDIGRRIEVGRSVQRTDFPGDHVYTEGVIIPESTPPMQVAVQNIKNHLIQGEPLLCTGDDAVKTLRVCRDFVPPEVLV